MTRTDEPAPAATPAGDSAATLTRIRAALPFWMSVLLLPLAVIAAGLGGWWVLLLPGFAWGLYSVIDALAGLNQDNADPDTPEAELFWYRAITMIWFPLQMALVYGMIWYVTRATHLGGWETFGLFFGVGVVSGTIGIVYSHELMHQTNRVERWLADLLLASVLYSHFRSEHLLVHHRYVGTPRDPVTARYNEGFHRYFYRVLTRCPPSAWRAEVALLERRGLSAPARYSKSLQLLPQFCHFVFVRAHNGHSHVDFVDFGPRFDTICVCGKGQRGPGLFEVALRWCYRADNSRFCIAAEGTPQDSCELAVPVRNVTVGIVY